MNEQERKEKNRIYQREYRKRNKVQKSKIQCDMDCFHCKFSDCRNSGPPTAKEKEMLRNAYGLNDPLYLERRDATNREKARAYRRMMYRLKKEQSFNNLSTVSKNDLKKY